MSKIITLCEGIIAALKAGIPDVSNRVVLVDDAAPDGKEMARLTIKTPALLVLWDLAPSDDTVHGQVNRWNVHIVVAAVMEGKAREVISVDLAEQVAALAKGNQWGLVGEAVQIPQNIHIRKVRDKHLVDEKISICYCTWQQKIVYSMDGQATAPTITSILLREHVGPTSDHPDTMPPIAGNPGEWG